MKLNRFGAQLKRLRTGHGLLQKELTKSLSCSLMAISNWESGRFLPEPDKLPLIQTALKLDKGEFTTLLAAYNQDKQSRLWDEEFKRQLGEDIEKELARIQQHKIPLLGAKGITDPADFFFYERREWRGEQLDCPTDLEGRRAFAYRLTDESMVPRFNPDDLLFCDLDVPPTDGKPVVAYFKGNIICRILERQGHRILLKALDPQTRLIATKRSQLGWLYRVVMRLSDER